MSKKVLYTMILLSFWTISCNNDSREKLIVGTWVIVSPGGDMAGMKVKFLANKIGVAVRKDEVPGSGDSVTYEIKNEGKLLVTTERSGRIEEVEILELTRKDLTIVTKDRGDTIKLARE
jgi:hypothetical protein